LKKLPFSVEELVIEEREREREREILKKIQFFLG
jgi:hypothetical protein